MPGPSAYGLLSYWFKDVVIDDCLEVLCVTEPDDHVSIRVAHDQINSQAFLHITLSDATYLNWIDALGSVELSIDGDWHNVIVSWDTSAGAVNYALDRITGSLSALNVAGVGFSVPYTNDGYVLFGSSISGAMRGAFAEVFFLIPDGPIALNSSTIDKFVDADGFAVDIGATGAGAFGQDTRPNVYLSGGEAMFGQNIAFDTFTLVSRTPASPSRIFAGGPDATITNANDGPFPTRSAAHMATSTASVRLVSSLAFPRSLAPALPR